MPFWNLSVPVFGQADDTLTKVGIGAGLTSMLAVGVAVGGAIGAILAQVIKSAGESLVKPWLESKGYDRALKAAQDELAKTRVELEATRKQADETHASQARDIDENRQRIAAMEDDLRAKDMRIAEALQSQASAMNKLADMSQSILVMQGRIRPYRDHRVTPAEVDAAKRGATTPIRALVVEDDPRAARPMREILERHGFICTIRDSLQDGLIAVDTEPYPEVVVLDLMLPDGDGSEILKSVRDRGLPIRVVVTTGRDLAQLDYVRALKPDALLIKPLNVPDELIPALRGEKSVATEH